MPAAHSIVGYLPDSLLNELKQGKAPKNQPLELPLQPGQGGSRIRVRHEDIDELRVGPAAKGHTSVQIILKPQASYDLVSPAPREEQDIAAIHDPSFIYAMPNLRFVIYAGPVYKNEAGNFTLI